MHPKGLPLDPQARLALSRAVAEHGETHVAAEVGFSLPTLARALGGLPIYGTSKAAIRAYLERSKQAA
jgi:hypothetical protein